MLVLDLYSDVDPQVDFYKGFYGQPFIWCALHNFGGKLGLYGNLARYITVCT